VARAQKAGVPAYILLVDQRPGETVTRLPSGELKTLIMRDVDVENVKKLRAMKGITLLETPRDIEKIYSTDE